MRGKLKLLAALPLAAGLVAVGAGPAMAAPNENASCVAQTGNVFGPPGRHGDPIGGQLMSTLAHVPRNVCPGVGGPIPS